ncbi:MAG TPA: MFS transporter [Cyclobacteriaceae bacterium]|nr:MFS transporter [Cyclobacteriaceae bacterium]
MKARLMLMMFLQFFIWGAWYATGGNYMKSHGMADVIYLAYMASPVGSIVSPFFLGMIADRFFPVQRVMGVMHILSGVFIFCAPLLAETSSLSAPFFLAFLFFHMLCYMPTVGLATATAFHLLKSKEHEFPLVRVFGTMGWITAGFVVSFLLKGDTTALPMHVAGIGGIFMGIYSFTLPHVPPPGAGKKFSFRDIVGIDALTQLSSRPFNLFIVGLLLISIPFASYFAYVPLFLKAAGVESPAFKMTFGQMSEIIFLLLMPWFFRKFGLKRVLILGFAAWTLRYGLFMLSGYDGGYWMLIAGILLHGACYDFVYVAGQVYIDKSASIAIRAQAQGLFVLVSYGIGQGLGTLSAGWIFNSIIGSTADPSPQQWQNFWTIPLIFAAVVTAMFAFGFKEKTILTANSSPDSSATL